MAGEKTNDAVVEIPEEGVVTVDITDNPDLATAGAEEGAETTPVVKVAGEVTPKEKKPAVPRLKLPKEPAEPDEATKALNVAVANAKTAEDRAKAAEATAIAERRRADGATQTLSQREQELAAARENVEATAMASINSGIEGATALMASLQEESTRLMEAGEFAKVTAVNAKMARAAATLDRLETQKAEYEAGVRKAPTTEGRVEVQQQHQPINAFEQYVSQFAPKAQAWLRQHPDCAPASIGGNAAKNSKMMAGHYDSLAKGLTEGSEEYFQNIEEHAGYRTPVSAAAQVTAAGEEDDATPAPKVKKVPVAAPVSREVPAANGSVARTSRQVTLNKDQQDAAKMSFPNLPVKEAFAIYARNLLELEAEGKLGRLTH